MSAQWISRIQKSSILPGFGSIVPRMGGANFSDKNAPHDDHHAFASNPIAPSTIYALGTGESLAPPIEVIAGRSMERVFRMSCSMISPSR